MVVIITVDRMVLPHEHTSVQVRDLTDTPVLHILDRLIVEVNLPAIVASVPEPSATSKIRGAVEGIVSVVVPVHCCKGITVVLQRNLLFVISI